MCYTVVSVILGTGLPRVSDADVSVILGTGLPRVSDTVVSVLLGAHVHVEWVCRDCVPS
jgi:alanine dehydrogenase